MTEWVVLTFDYVNSTMLGGGRSFLPGEITAAKIVHAS